ncbi:hypothetical protein E3U43_002979 [Larimichthys crocea]|uniref:Uncharacterized protein n=1 Tax=Larimichthys crocea TaxID=215358 RepID=A0ACD3QT20_LARCR|nr:hypothetical protein E3U43_002979 [Larimichthys crocea]
MQIFKQFQIQVLLNKKFPDKQTQSHSSDSPLPSPPRHSSPYTQLPEGLPSNQNPPCQHLNPKQKLILKVAMMQTVVRLRGLVPSVLKQLSQSCTAQCQCT